MIIRNVALVTIAVGVVAFVAGLYGVVGPLSLFLAGFGLVVLLGGTGLLLFTARPWRLSSPHPYVIAGTVVAAALHTYENVYKSYSDPLIGFLLWSMVPYGLCLMLSAFSTTKLPVIAGTALALAFGI